MVPRGAGSAAVITSPTGVKHRYASRLSFALESDRCTNNIAEYEAVILGLRKLRALGVTTYIIRTDSKVVAGQGSSNSSATVPGVPSGQVQLLSLLHLPKSEHAMQ
jgi:ribonuclease HI